MPIPPLSCLPPGPPPSLYYTGTNIKQVQEGRGMIEVNNVHKSFGKNEVLKGV
jgi:hypothetical protein